MDTQRFFLALVTLSCPVRFFIKRRNNDCLLEGKEITIIEIIICMQIYLQWLIIENIVEALNFIYKNFLNVRTLWLKRKYVKWRKI